MEQRSEEEVKREVCELILFIHVVVFPLFIHEAQHKAIYVRGTQSTSLALKTVAGAWLPPVVVCQRHRRQRCGFMPNICGNKAR